MLLYDVCYVCSGLAALGSLSKEVHSVAFQVETIKQTLMSHCYVLFNPVTNIVTVAQYMLMSHSLYQKTKSRNIQLVLIMC